MICPNCSEDNHSSSIYCRNCGYHFSDAQRQAAYDQTIYGKIDKGRRIADILTLKFITDTIWFKVLSIVLILALGVWLRISGVQGFRLESSDDYEIQYLKETDTYYLITEEPTIPLRLVMPYGTKKLKVKELDEDGDTISSESYDPEEGITLDVSGKIHYKLSTSNGKKTTGSLVLYLYLSED